MSSGCWKKWSLSDTSRLCLGLCTVGTIRIFLHNQRSVLLEYFDPTIRLADKIKKCPPFVKYEIPFRLQTKKGMT